MPTHKDIKVRVGSIIEFDCFPTKVKIQIKNILNGERIEGICVEEDSLGFHFVGQPLNCYTTDIIKVITY